MVDSGLILYQQNYFKPLIDKANELTEAYVSKHKLMLTGGMAIDIALRAKKSQIYDDDALSDYDIISDQNIDHANALAEILCNAGLPDINVINAVHVTTVRVRMKNISFLDATYAPSSVFKRIPYLDIGELRVIHPHYQFIDQRYSLSTLLIDTGISLNVFNRLAKDIGRNDLLREYYPIESKLQSMTKTSLIRIPLDLITLEDTKLEEMVSNIYIYTGATCISGYAAYLIYMKKYKIVNEHLELEFPDEMQISMLTCDIDSINYNLDNAKTFNSLLNIKPKFKRDGRYDFLDTYGYRIGCNIIDLTSEIKVCLVSYDYIALEMLRDRVYVAEEPYTFIYSQLVKDIDIKRSDPDNKDSNWYPSLNSYGKVNLAEYKIVGLERIMHNVKDDNTPFPLIPKNLYLRFKKCTVKESDFSQSQSHYFELDGLESKTSKYTNYKHIIEQFNTFIDETNSQSKRS